MSSSPPIDELEGRFFPAGPTIHRQNSSITFAIDGEEYFRRIGAQMVRCTGFPDAIYIVGWTFETNMHLPGVVPAISTLLQQKAAAGVDVRVLLWASRWLTGTDMADTVPERLFNFGAETAAQSYVEVVQRNIAIAQELRALGAPDFPLKETVLLDWSGTRSHHAKYTIVKVGDEIHAFIGIDYRTGYMDVPRHPGSIQWHDNGLELQGSAVVNVWKDFWSRWNECQTLPPAHFRTTEGPKLYNPPINFVEPPTPTPSPQTSSYSVQILRSYGRTKYFKYFVESERVPWLNLPPNGIHEIKECFAKAILAGRKYIYVEDQALNDKMNSHIILFPLIAQALNNSDVKVIFVTSSEPDVVFKFPSGPPTLSWEVLLRILDAVPSAKRQNFVLYRVDKLTVHAKVILIDDRFVSMGSANFFDASMTGTDSELTLAAVDTGSLVRDLRVELWKDHLRLDPNDSHMPTWEAELQDPDKALSVWRPGWGTGVSFEHPGPVLKLVSAF